MSDDGQTTLAGLRENSTYLTKVYMNRLKDWLRGTRARPQGILSHREPGDACRVVATMRFRALPDRAGRGPTARQAGALIAIVLAALAGAAQAAEPAPDQPPGQRYSIQPDQLPLPYATESAGNGAEVVARPDSPTFRVPPGFHVNLFAENVRYPRWMTVAPNGDVFLTEPDAGRVRLRRETAGSGRAGLNVVYANGFRHPHGLAIHDGYLYVTDVRRVWRLPWKDGETKPGGPAEPVTEAGTIGDGEGHWTRNILFS